jgi:hypothetical protein
MTKEQLAQTVGEFVWLFSYEFFIETAIGNFIWKDPDYNGDGSIRKYDGNLKQYLQKTHIPFGRDKGKHLIGDYCGDFSFKED